VVEALRSLECMLERGVVDTLGLDNIVLDGPIELVPVVLVGDLQCLMVVARILLVGESRMMRGGMKVRIRVSSWLRYMF